MQSFCRLLFGITCLFGKEIRLSWPEIGHRDSCVPLLYFICFWMTIVNVIEFVRRLYERWDIDFAQAMLTRFASLGLGAFHFRLHFIIIWNLIASNRPTNNPPFNPSAAD